MTTQNWPDPKRPGVPMFPDYYGEHILKELVTGKEVPACWDANCPRSPRWDISALNSQTPETIALYFTYVRCETIKLTPTQINEMLAAERERAARVAQEVSDKYYNEREKAYHQDAREYADERMCAASECAKAIRNLGSEP